MVEEGKAPSCLREYNYIGYMLDVGRFMFANRVCEEWNGLDDTIVYMMWLRWGSVNAFKRKLDHHLRNVRGYF